MHERVRGVYRYTHCTFARGPTGSKPQALAKDKRMLAEVHSEPRGRELEARDGAAAGVCMRAERTRTNAHGGGAPRREGVLSSLKGIVEGLQLPPTISPPAGAIRCRLRAHHDAIGIAGAAICVCAVCQCAMPVCTCAFAPCPSTGPR